ncbi:uncharacterized protein LOC131930588 [Physella acuta]|uniref:uncharacterized protein LOC131930588 n=1 Tax=Physella acuta TaxID=109671 RepID=UPI0027DD5EB8|nr:uncharacterized protein LOC131930588 [Physella acuta]
MTGQINFLIPLAIYLTCSAVRSQKMEIVKIPRLVVSYVQDGSVLVNLTAEVFINTSGASKAKWPVNNITLTYYFVQIVFKLDVTNDPCDGSRNNSYLTCLQAVQDGYYILVNYPHSNYYYHSYNCNENNCFGYLYVIWTGIGNSVWAPLYLYNYDVNASQTVTITTNLSTNPCLGKLQFKDIIVDLYVNTTSYGQFDDNELDVYVPWSSNHICQILIHKRECITVDNICGYCVNITDDGYLIRLNVSVSDTFGYQAWGFSINARWNFRFSFEGYFSFEVIEWLQAEAEMYLYFGVAQNTSTVTTAEFVFPGYVTSTMGTEYGNFSLKLATGDEVKLYLTVNSQQQQLNFKKEELDKDIVLTSQLWACPRETFICNSFAQLCDPVTVVEESDIVRVTLTCPNSSGPNYLLVNGGQREATSVECQSQDQCHTWIFEVEVNSLLFILSPIFKITYNNFGCRKIENIESKPVIENCPKGDDVRDGYVRTNSPASCTCRMESNSPYSTALVQWMTSDYWPLTELGKIVVIDVAVHPNYAGTALVCRMTDLGEPDQDVQYQPKFYGKFFILFLDQELDHEIPTVKEVTVNGSDVITADPGTAVRLYCRVDGLPSAIAVTTGSGLGRVKENRSVSDALEIVLSDLQCRDSGRYYCWGSNGFETNQSRRQKFVDVNVNCAPKLKNETTPGEVQKVKVTPNTNTSVGLEIFGYPPPTAFQLKTETGKTVSDVSLNQYKVTYSDLTPPLGLVNLTIYDAEVKVTVNYILTLRNEVGESDVRMQVIKQEVHVDTDTNVPTVGIIVGVVVAILIIVLIAVVVFVYKKRKTDKSKSNDSNEGGNGLSYVNSVMDTAGRVVDTHMNLLHRCADSERSLLTQTAGREREMILESGERQRHGLVKTGERQQDLLAEIGGEQRGRIIRSGEELKSGLKDTGVELTDGMIKTAEGLKVGLEETGEQQKKGVVKSGEEQNKVLKKTGEQQRKEISNKGREQTNIIRKAGDKEGKQISQQSQKERKELSQFSHKEQTEIGRLGESERGKIHEVSVGEQQRISETSRHEQQKITDWADEQRERSSENVENERRSGEHDITASVMNESDTDQGE